MPRYADSARVQRLVWSISQDLIYGASGGQVITSKHVLLPWAIKTLTGNVEAIKFINRLGHGISYSKLEEIDTALCLQKLNNSEENLPLPQNTYCQVPTVLAFDNIDRLEETLSGSGTSHRVNGIIIQPQVLSAFNPPQYQMTEKGKQRSIPLTTITLPQYVSGIRKSPPAITPIEPLTPDTNEIRLTKLKNLTWILTRLMKDDTQLVSSRTGFNILTNKNENEIVKPDTIGYLPTINAPATHMSTVHEVHRQAMKIMKTLCLSEIVLVFDQALYAKAAEIVWNDPDYYKPIILRMGAFHTICNDLSVVGKRFREAGLRDIAVESGIIAEGSIDAVLDGRHYNRGVRLLKTVYEGLSRLYWKAFEKWIGQHHPEKLPTLEELFINMKDLSLNPNYQFTIDVMNSSAFEEITALVDHHQNYLRNESSPLASFWMSYINMAENILALIRASREGNWILHLQAIRSLIPLCFAYDKQNYARYLSVYHSQMSRLPLTHPDSYQHLLAGGFSVQRSTTNAFARIPVDQTLEETVNRDTQTAGGTKGFSLKPATVSKYYLTAEYRNTSLKQLRNLVDRNQGTNTHQDFSQIRMRKDEENVQSVVDLLEENWINPFDENDGELISISTSVTATEDVANDLLRAEEKGEAAYKTFIDSRLSQGAFFYDRLTKLNLKTFSSIQTKNKTKSVNKDTILKAEHHLFGRMILIASTRKLNMETVFEHPLGPLPWSLANNDGSMKKTNKSSLARHLEVGLGSYPQDSLFHPSVTCTIIDGMAQIQKLKGDNYTFGELSHHLLTLVLQIGSGSRRIDIVLDVYKEVSIKNAERIKRGSDSGITFSRIVAGHKIKNWRRLLQSSSSKENLVTFLAEDWCTKLNIIGENSLYVEYNQKCLSISGESSAEVNELKCSHEEAETRMILHASNAAKHGFKSIIIVTEDTDVLVLGLAFSFEIPAEIKLKCGTKTRTRLVNVTKIASKFGPDLCKAMLGLHAFTGCDTVSAFSGQGKIKGLKILRQNLKYQVAFASLGDQFHLESELFNILQDFTCRLYNATTNVTLVNVLRYQLWRAKKGTVESGQLPPCADALYLHTLRANYQTGIWRRSLAKCPDIPSPDGNGWKIENDGHLSIKWITGSPAPEAILEFIACNCSKSCEGRRCQCLSNGLKCTDACKIQNCSNFADPTQYTSPLDTIDTDSEDDN